MTINLDAATFAAVSLACGVDKVRTCLWGVYVEPLPAGGALMVATDGHLLLMAEDPEGQISAPALLRLKGGLTAKTVRPAKGGGRPRITAEALPEAGTGPVLASLMFPGGVFGGAVALENLRETFPAWRRIAALARDGVGLPYGYVLDPILIDRASRAFDMAAGKRGGRLRFTAHGCGDPIWADCPTAPLMFAVIGPPVQPRGGYPAATRPHWLEG